MSAVGTVIDHTTKAIDVDGGSQQNELFLGSKCRQYDAAWMSDLKMAIDSMDAGHLPARRSRAEAPNPVSCNKSKARPNGRGLGYVYAWQLPPFS